MFKLQPNPTFKAKVAIPVAGKPKPEQVEMEFKYLAGEQLAEWARGLEGATNLEALTAIVVGWSGVDEAFSHDALALLLDNYQGAAAAIFKTFNDEVLGARAKN